MPMHRAMTAEEWAEFVSHSFYPLSLQRAETAFSATVRASQLGPSVRLTEVTTSGSVFRRSSRLISSHPTDDLLLLMQISGTSKVEQGDGRAELRPGEAMFFDPTEPYAIRGTRGEQIVAMVPRVEALGPRGDARTIRLRSLSASSAPLRVLRALSTEVLGSPRTDTRDELEGIEKAALDLIRTTSSLMVGESPDAMPWSHGLQRRRLQEFIRSNLNDPNLSVELIARAHLVSPRHLNNLFAADGGLANYIRRERVLRAENALRGAQPFGTSISEIAISVGFRDATTFTRAFKRQLGITPRELRNR